MPKFDLNFPTPFMNAAGMLGFAPDHHAGGRAVPPGTADEMGAFVTNPLSLRPRVPAAGPEMLEFPGGLLLHTGLPNPGFSAAVRKYARRWAANDQPVIIHLMADRPEETARMVRSIESLENIMAVELGFAPLLADDLILVALEMSLGELPLVLNLPFEQVLGVGARAVQAGAAAISFAPPRGSLPREDGSLASGRLYGPALFPQSLNLLQAAARLGLPVIGGVGVYNSGQAAAMLAAGALAVQLDTVLWI